MHLSDHRFPLDNLSNSHRDSAASTGPRILSRAEDRSTRTRRYKNSRSIAKPPSRRRMGSNMSCIGAALARLSQPGR
ncbi:hypothetical protein PG988_003581 [Apiospora saccharicola]